MGFYLAVEIDVLLSQRVSKLKSRRMQEVVQLVKDIVVVRETNILNTVYIRND